MGLLWIAQFLLWGTLFSDIGRANMIGTKFITTLMQNGPSNLSSPKMELRISGTGDKTEVTVEVMGGSYKKSITITGKMTIAMPLPESAENRGSISFSNTVVVSSDNPISVLSLNSKYRSAETSVVYPTSSLGTEYYAITPKTGASGTSKVCAVIASIEETSVVIYTKGSVQVNGERHAANSAIKVTLQPLHGIQMLSSDDLSGSRVASEKPVAVLCGHTCAQKNTQCNHVYEQLLPVSSWATNYLVPPLSFQQANDLVYVVAARETEVNYFFNTIHKKENMVAGQVLEIEISKIPLRIEASGGTQVTYLNTGGRGQRFEYDPFLMNIIGLENFCSSYFVYGQRGTDNYAIIIAESSSTADIRFNGRPISNPTWTEISGTKFSWLQHNFGNSLTSHIIEHPSKKFGVQSVGIGSTFSYGSPATCAKDPGPPPPSCQNTLCSSRQVCVMQNGNPKCVKPQVDLCWASGDPHFRTWDNRYYDFMGTCTYTFATVCGDVGDLPRFTIRIKNDNRGNVRVSYVGQVTLLTGPHTIVVKKGEFGQIRVDNAPKHLPGTLMNGTLKLFQSGNSVVMQLANDMQLSYDWNNILRVEITRRYVGKMCGMCGNYNQDPKDDFQTPEGTAASNVIAFGSSWKVEDNTVCWHDCRGPCLSCPPSFANKYSTVDYCGLMNKEDGPFRECHAVVDPKIYMENCIYDVCINGGFRKIFCDTVQAYAETCQSAEVAIKDWRMAAGCPMQCPKDSSYNLCGRACPATCEDPEGEAVCIHPCAESCHCNSGFVLSKGKCIPKAQCGCSYNGFTYAPNEAFWNDTTCKQRCVCNEKTQKLECTDSPCKAQEECAVRNGIQNCYPRSYGVCTASGDPHYITYDGTKFDFQGTCVYQFTALCDKNHGLTHFEIWVQNENRGNIRVSYTKAVYIKVYDLEIEASRQYPNKVMINKRLINLPYMSNDGRLSFYRNPCSAVFSFDFGLKVLFDYNSIIRVAVPGAYANAVCGLCGNFNGNPSDDLTPKDGASPTDPTKFGKSWKVQETLRCRDDEGAVCHELASEEKRQRATASECGVIMNQKGPFRDCLSLVDPEPYFKSCVYDYCILQKRQIVFCSAMTSYVMACQDVGGTVHPWRSQILCPMSCPANSTYELCADACPVTCNGLSTPQGCNGNCTEGCVCNNGFILSGGQCVPIAECGCNHNGTYYSVGESVYDGDSCDQKCSCTEGGVMTCVQSYCSRTEECRIQNGVLGCFPRGSAMCTAAGYSRYRTFDNHTYNFGGYCSYVLAESNGVITEGRNLTAFRVTIKHEKRDSGPGKIRSVTVESHEMTLTLNRGENGVIQVNSETFRLPVTLKSGNIRAEWSGQGGSITIAQNILVRYNPESVVSITLPGNYMDAVHGLCGTYNGLAEDDTGKTPEEISAIGNKWKVPGEPDGCDGCGGRDNPCPTCREEKKKIFLQSNYCGIISDPSGPCAKCHSEVNPEPYVTGCVSDLCQTNGEDSSVLCQSVSMYTDDCRFAGVKDITWRTEDFCPVKCGPHSHYTTCADMCSTTCASIYDTYECSDLCDEGCECDEGHVFDGENCLPLDQCGCFDNGRYYKANETVLSDDCSLSCTCDPISGLSCHNTSCSAGDRCQIVDGVRSCVNLDPCKSKVCRTKETCQLLDGQARCKADFTGICWAFGDPHFLSFDGHQFDFQGTCSYVLSEYKGNDPTLEQFQVVIKNNNRGSQAVSYVKMTNISVYDIEIAIGVGEYPRIRVNDELTYLPVTLANGKLKATRSGLTASVETDFGLIATFDWNWYATMKLPSSYYNAVSGLCGNFNQDVKDDQRSPNGTIVTSIPDWAASWKVHDQDPFCFDHCPGQCQTCDQAKKQQYGGDDACGLLLKESGPFRECIAKVNPKNFFDPCLFDVCMVDGAKNSLCQSLETYASACLKQGVKLFDWRTPSNCPMICKDENSHYIACGNACPASCFDRNAPANCTKPCVEACECNKGLVLSGDKCVPTSSCGCQYNGRYYDPDQSWYNEKCSVQCKCDSLLGMVVCKEMKCKDSETCMMSNGVRGCYPKKYSTCIASGDSHYTTFDKRKIDFMGTCTYLLAGSTSEDPSLSHFTITVRNEHRGNKAVSFTQEVIFLAYNMTINLSRDHPQQIKVNGRLVNLPYYFGLNSIAYTSGSNILLKTDFDLSLTIDGWSYVRVILPSTYTGAVNGLCGNNNGDPNDDLNMKDGIEAKSAEEFGSHWKVREVEGCEAVCSDCSKCNEADKEPYKSDKHCGLLTKTEGPFSQCHNAINPTPFFIDCLFNACAFKGRQPMFCHIIASYASECQRNGSTIKEWRTPSFCGKTCPANSHYNLLGDGCPVTCYGLIAPLSCVKSYTEGCYCNDGFMWSGDDCVPMSGCGCVYENVYYKSGQEFFADNLCQKKCKCGKDGQTDCQAHTCGANEECKMVDGVLDCHAKEFGQCIAWGDPHYITFDGNYYVMQGTCSYILFSLKTEKVNFVVTVENEPYGNVAVTKSVTVIVGGLVIYLERQKTWSVEVNKERFHLPCQSRKHQFWINEEGNNVILQTRYGITLVYDRQYFVSVWVPSSYAGLTEGLCGNFNKDPKDDIRLPNGSIAADLTEFVESWAVGGQRSECRGCSGDQCFTCDHQATTEAQSPNKCGLIADPQGPFKDCHAMVTPESFVKSCVFDYCASGVGQDALCASLQMYTSMCQEKGAKLGVWRDMAGCPHSCPANSSYEICTKTCKSTCNSLVARSTCSDRCYEGCQCDGEFMFDGKNCVTMNKCGCNHDGRYLKADENVMSDNCSQECTCNPEGGLSCRPVSCAEDETCDVLDGVRTCVKKDPCKMKTCHLKETCQVIEDKAVCVANFIGQCWAWGEHHFISFDGRAFDFQGTCSYVFSEYKGDDPTLEPFQIIIKNDNRGNRDVSFIKKMEMTMYGRTISAEVAEFPQIRVDGELTNLPVTLAEGKFRVHGSGLVALVESAAGVTATFDWNSYATVTVPSSYYNVVSGLCGNFNQNPNDDQQSRNGNQVTSITDWAASWKVHDRDPFCFDSCPGQCPTCEESKKKLYGGDDSCGILFKTDGPFRECMSKVSPNKFFDGCLYDVCMNDGAKVMLCQALKSYASTCMSEGVKIHDWRTSSDCPKICEDPNSHYNACGNACPATCTEKGAPEKCSKPCVETCECNEDMVLSGDKCVITKNCGCQHNGRYYNPNQSWYNEKCSVQCKCDPDRAQVVCQSARCKESEMCQIMSGIRGCYPKEYSTCIASGDAHFTTFDEKKIDFMGTCTYLLVGVTSDDPSLTHFTINVRKEHRGNKAVSFIQVLSLEAYNMTITLSREHPQQIKVNGRFVNLPYYSESKKITIYSSGFHIIVKTKFHMTLSFDDFSYVTVKLPNTYKGVVHGLCGNNNGDPADDFILQDGVMARNPEEFGKHWKVGEVEGCEDVCLDCPKCNVADKEVYKNEQYCGLLTRPDGPFSQCHGAIDPTSFFDYCVNAECAYKGPQSQSSACASIAAYVSECQRNGSTIKEWRTPSFCGVTCPANSHYNLLGDGCPATCFGFISPPACVKSITEGCYCNNGFMRSGDDCVTMAGCGCVYENVYYKIGQQFFPDNLCQKKCACGNNGQTICQAHTCGDNEECKVVDGIFGCHAKEYGQCITWGGPHYVTFDNVKYDMQGTCSYTLVRLREKRVTFVVTVENEPYGNVAVTKSVTVVIADHVIHLERGRTWSIKVNRERYNVPCKSQKQEYWINQEGNNVIIQTMHGFKVLFDGQSYISIWVPSTYAGRTVGLCGNFNKDPTDDFLLTNGTIVTDVSLFAESWSEATNGSTCRGCSGSQCPTCSEAATVEANSTTKCGMIADPQGPFKDCHALVPPTTYADSCVFDVCARRGGQENLCASLQAYTALCQEKGAIVQSWRDVAGCAFTCPANSKYSLCTRTCEFNCYGLLAPIRSSNRCYEGCECDSGLAFDGNRCVTTNNCGCVMPNGRYLKLNESVLNEDCSQECTCDPKTMLTCRNRTCAEDEKCQLLDGVKSCVSTDPCKFKTCRLKETCKVQDDQAVCVPDYTGQCWAWGDPHFQTFDKKAFSFQGTCSYVLAEFSGDNSNLEPFRVIIKNDNRGSQASSFVRKMEITIYGIKISAQVGEFPKMRVNDEMANLPISLSGGKLTVTRSGLMAVIETKSGVSATFDWNWYATVNMSSSYHNVVSGLCGNFNQNPDDDQQSRNGTHVDSITDWAALWKVYDRDPFCFDSCPGQCPTCEESKKKLYGGEDHCGIVFKTDGPFRECISTISPNKFFDGCLYDVCTNDGSRKILCQSLEAYATTCMSNGIKIYDWRTSSSCPKLCEDKNSHYNACGNACPASCSDRNAPERCTKPCVETCECEKGLVSSGNTCVAISSCGCQHKDRYYEPNESWTNEECSEVCKCDPILGTVKCHKISCRESETCGVVNGRRGCHPTGYSTCVAHGDPHYKTFDGRRFAYMGSCKYHLVKVTSNDSSLVQFTINVVNDHRGNKAVSFTEMIILEIYNVIITMSKHHPQQIKVDGVLTEVPYYYSNEGRNLISVYSSGKGVIVKTDMEIKVTYDGWNYVTVVMPSTYKGAVNGLCGNNNGDPSDDFTTADNRIATSAEEFAEHWKVEDVDGCTEVCSDCDKCSEADKEPYKSEQYCGLLIKPDGPFSQCHGAIDPNPFFADCLFDVCAYKGHQSIVCDSMSTYISECQRNGSVIKEWRTPSFCEWTCPSNSHYELSGNGCPSTCYGRTSPLDCEKTSTEGCYCNSGFIRSGQDCVPMSGCGCTYKNVYYKSCQEFFLDNLCQEKCKCGDDGQTDCQAHTCGANEECKMMDGNLGCHAKELGQCVAWGNPHFITFDKQYYAMQGTCSYILVNVTTKAVKFVVIVKNEPYGNVAVTKSVTVIFGDQIIYLERGRTWSIEVNRERYNIPCISPTRESWVNQEGNNLIFETIHGFKVLYDRQYYVSIWVPSTYAGLTEGLCGNFNKDPNDDYRLPNGTLETDLSLFAKSWTVARDGSTCTGCSGSQCPTCSEAATAEANSSTKCGMIADPQGPFKDCHALVPPKTYAESCVFDSCAGRDGQETLCASLQAYTISCQEKGAKIGPWRTLINCSHSCPANSSYEVCAKTCESTCNSLLAPSTCSDRCYEGCQCDTGFMFDGEKCVTMDKCGCNLNGRYVKAGESVVTEGCVQRCTCQSGSLSCVNLGCAKNEICQLREGVRGCQPVESQCVLRPDHNFITFDGVSGQFPTDGSYVMSSSCSADAEDQFMVVVEIKECGGKALQIYTSQGVISVNGQQDIWVNGWEIEVSRDLGNGSVKIQKNELNTIIELYKKIIVIFYKSGEIALLGKEEASGKICGPCGNFNRDADDDLRLKSGEVSADISFTVRSWTAKHLSPCSV